MNTSLSQRSRDYKKPSDPFWKHSTIETLYDVSLYHVDGHQLADVTVRGAGHPYTGIEWMQPYDEDVNMVFKRSGDDGHTAFGTRPEQRYINHSTWDCREWQMWRGRTYGREQRPRWVPAQCGHQASADHLRIWCQYEVDGVRTRQEWFFGDQLDAESLVYDCLITVENISSKKILDYTQFFACYTEVNGRDGAYFWDKSGELVLSWDIGIEHLDKFIVAEGSPIDEAGSLPHFPRTEGLVGAHWKKPVLVGQRTSRNWRHVVMVEQTYAAAITLGMTGVAMDYVLYPGRLVFQPGESFTNHIRHFLLRSPDLPELERLGQLYHEFGQDHERIKCLTQSWKGAKE